MTDLRCAEVAPPRGAGPSGPQGGQRRVPAGGPGRCRGPADIGGVPSWPHRCAEAAKAAERAGPGGRSLRGGTGPRVVLYRPSRREASQATGARPGCRLPGVVDAALALLAEWRQGRRRPAGRRRRRRRGTVDYPRVRARAPGPVLRGDGTLLAMELLAEPRPGRLRRRPHQPHRRPPVAHRRRPPAGHHVGSPRAASWRRILRRADSPVADLLPHYRGSTAIGVAGPPGPGAPGVRRDRLGVAATGGGRATEVADGVVGLAAPVARWPAKPAVGGGGGQRPRPVPTAASRWSRPPASSSPSP